VYSLEGREALQQDLYRLKSWAITMCVKLTRAGVRWSTWGG